MYVENRGFRPKKLSLFNKRYQKLARTLSRGSFSTKFLKINQTSEAGWQGVTKRVRHIFRLKAARTQPLTDFHYFYSKCSLGSSRKNTTQDRFTLFLYQQFNCNVMHASTVPMLRLGPREGTQIPFLFN